MRSTCCMRSNGFKVRSHAFRILFQYACTLLMPTWRRIVSNAESREKKGGKGNWTRWCVRGTAQKGAIVLSNYLLTIDYNFYRYVSLFARVNAAL